MADDKNGSGQGNGKDDGMQRNQRLYYLNRVVHISLAAVPLVFFCSLLERFFRAVITGAGAPTLWWQSKAAPLPASPAGCPPFSAAAGMASQDLWFTGLFLVCLTVLLIASMVLLGRVVRRE